MGEYAMLGNERIKIGTCENMYYLRADQAHLVRAEDGNVDPIKDAEHIRFRFPFPDEDGVTPGGAFHERGYHRGISLHMTVPEGIEHGSLQFRAEPGYLVSLPCPEGAVSGTVSPYTIHRNGFPGAVQITQQRCLDDFRMLVCKCAGCGYSWRVPTLAETAPYVEALLKLAGRDKTTTEAKFYHEVCRRIEVGYEPGAGDLTRRHEPLRVAS